MTGPRVGILFVRGRRHQPFLPLVKSLPGAPFPSCASRDSRIFSGRATERARRERADNLVAPPAGGGVGGIGVHHHHSLESRPVVGRGQGELRQLIGRQEVRRYREHVHRIRSGQRRLSSVEHDD